MRVRASQSVIDGGLCLICLYRVHTDHWTIWWSHTNHTKSNPTFQASDSPLFLYYDVILTTVMLDSIQALDVVFFYSKFSNLVWNSLYYTSSSYYFFIQTFPLLSLLVVWMLPLLSNLCLTDFSLLSSHQGYDIIQFTFD